MKEQIIDEAISLFSEKGYFNTSLNEIAKKVDIKKQVCIIILKVKMIFI